MCENLISFNLMMKCSLGCSSNSLTINKKLSILEISRTFTRHYLPYISHVIECDVIFKKLIWYNLFISLGKIFFYLRLFLIFEIIEFNTGFRQTLEKQSTLKKNRNTQGNPGKKNFLPLRLRLKLTCII